ncbi:transcriptional regulator GutM [Vibrio harveyi]|uniref:transcriptional regulator GutM n=1 Tax=Vibrio harveyi TaxID=669 RepID=UPI00031537E9|nr:transcriptional regulator GutM [Vibrio harveyi]
MMDLTGMLIYLAVIAWVLQITLGFLQIRAFNRMLQSMAKKGRVKIGRTQSRWKPRTVVVLAQDDSNHVVDARVMKGMSVFARPKVLSLLVGKKIPISPALLTKLELNVQEALNVAISKQ